jgi:prepilin signal peptidase PulO-like enzyme (type II secretory pathway)
MMVFRTALKYRLIKSKFKYLNNQRSRCDFCGNKLSWAENIPLLSWLILNGKSRCCHRSLPYQYPFVELLTGILFLVVNYNVIFSPNYYHLIILNIIIVTLLVFLAVFDFNFYILPDFSNYILVLIAMILNWQNWWVGLLSCAFLLLLNLITKGKGMGMGDVKYALFMGVYLGPTKIVIAFYLAFVVGAIMGLLLIVVNKKKRNSQIPFGPYLIAATLVAHVWGDKLLYYVYRWF